MKPQRSFTARSLTVTTRDHDFQVLIYAPAGPRPAYAEYCGSNDACERMMRIGVPHNLVFADEEARAEWLLKACLADITVLAGGVRTVKEGRAEVSLAA